MKKQSYTSSHYRQSQNNHQQQPPQAPGMSTPPGVSPSPSLETGSTVSDTYSSVSINSTYRHHQAGPFMPSTPTTATTGRGGPLVDPPQPVLVKDRQHKPKTLGSFGLLVVGLGGANGTTLLAGVLANRLGIHWHGPRGEPNTPNYYGCITQLDQRGKYGGVGYRNKVKGLADASMAAIGGWVRLNLFLYIFRVVILDAQDVIIHTPHLHFLCLCNNSLNKTGYPSDQTRRCPFTTTNSRLRPGATGQGRNEQSQSVPGLV